MPEENRIPPPGPTSELSRHIAARVRLKRHAHDRYFGNIWVGFGMAGMVGWTVALPTVLGTALGVWLDRHLPASHSWTVMFLVAGLFIGCLSASHWIAREHEVLRRLRERERERENKEDTAPTRDGEEKHG